MMANFDVWQIGRKAKRFRNRVRKGVPDCVRGKVWQMMMGSMVSTDEKLLKRPHYLQSAGSSKYTAAGQRQLAVTLSAFCQYFILKMMGMPQLLAK